MHGVFVFQPKGNKGKAPEKVVHPYSRKAAYLAREEIRLDKKERLVHILQVSRTIRAQFRRAIAHEIKETLICKTSN